MTTAERMSIALPPEMVAMVRSAVTAGEYASSSEVIRDALRDRTHMRRMRQQKGIAELRQQWSEALSDESPGVSAKPVLDRLARKYKAIADVAR
jgi:antitoxin ParD1/3/4